MGSIGAFINPPTIDAGTDLAENRFQAQAARAGTGTDQLNESVDYSKLIGDALAQQAGVFGNQNGLVQSLQAQAAGTGGPNLAQQQLANATNQNIQSQAGAVASMRGLNPAAAQRLIAMQGAGIQQQAAGQSADLRMQQQLAAQAQLGNILAQQAGANQQQLGTGAGALGQQNALNLQNQQGAQGINQNTAAQNATLKAQAQGMNLGVADQGGKLLGAGVGAAGTALAGAAHGTVVPGHAAHPGDDARNDTKPYLLSPGEVVVPRTVADNPEATAAFVAAIKRHKAKHGKGQ